MQPRKPLTKEQALALAADALREVGLERHAWMIEDPLRLELTLELAKNEHVEREYEDAWCRACHSSSQAEVHEPDCFVLHAYKYLNDPRFVLHEQMVAQRVADEARRWAEREQYERDYAANPCQEMHASRGQCRGIAGHAEGHSFPFTMTSMNGMLKELYSPAATENLAYTHNPLMNMFGVDRSADPVRLTGTVIPNPPLTMDGIGDSLFLTQRRGIVAETQVGHFDETGAWHPNHKDLPSDDPASKLITDLKQVPSVIVSPFIKDGTAYLFNNTLAVSPNDSRADFSSVDAMKKAKEALDKMNGRKP